MSSFLSHPIVAMIILLGVLIFVHEFGHYIVAKMLGVGVEVFSIGFGPRILSFYKKNTLYQIACIPLGGYVKLAGVLPAEPVPEAFKGQEMYKAPAWGRALILFAGPFANLLFAVGVYFSMGLMGIQQAPSSIGYVLAGGPAEAAGILPGDKVLSVDSKEVHTWKDLSQIIKRSAGKQISLHIERAGHETSYQVRPEAHKLENLLGEEEIQGKIGIWYGLVPSQLTWIQKPHSDFQSGDQIKTISFTGEEGAHYSLKTQYWYEVLEALNRAWKSQTKELHLELESSQEKGLVKTAILSTAPWHKKKNDIGESSKLSHRQSLAHLMGIKDSQLTIKKLGEGSSNKLLPGDEILEIDNAKLRDIFHFYDVLQKNKKQELEIKIKRSGNEHALLVSLKPIEQQRAEGKVIFYNLDVEFYGSFVYPEFFEEKYDDPFDAFLFGVKKTSQETLLMVRALGRLISGKIPLASLGGPIMIAKVAGDSAKAGFMHFLKIAALISINLGVINLFPIPLLDGGQLVIVGIEFIRRRPLPPLFIENYQKLGFVMVLSLVILATYNDLSRFWGLMVREIMGIFP